MLKRALLCLLLLTAGVLPALAEPIVLRRGNVAEPDTLDPQKSSTDYATRILIDLFLGLTTYNAKAEVVPGLAESWTVSKDRLVYTFKLRPGLVWSDGAAITADDVVAGARRALDPKTAAQYAYMAYNIKNAAAVNAGTTPVTALGVRAVDSRSVEFTLEKPSMTFLGVLADTILDPVPRHAIAKYGEDWAKAGNMVSSGPYVLAAWRANDHVRLVKNARFYDAANVKIDEVIYLPTDDDASALKRFRSGEIDMNARFQVSDYAWLKANMPGAARVDTASWVTYLVVNFTQPKFQDVRVRRALALAIDREALGEKLLKLGEAPAYGLVPPVVRGYQGATFDFKGMPLAARQEEARRLLAQAGYGPAKPLTVAFRQRMGVANRRVAVAIMDMWKAVGVKTDLIQSEIKTHYDALRTQDFEVGDVGQAWPADPEYFLADFLPKSENNPGRYVSAAYERLVVEGGGLTDPAARFARLKQAEEVLLKDVGIIPLYFNVNTNLVGPHVKGFEVNPRDHHPSRFLRVERAARP